jgi:hypothetical protein
VVPEVNADERLHRRDEAVRRLREESRRRIERRRAAGISRCMLGTMVALLMFVALESRRIHWAEVQNQKIARDEIASQEVARQEVARQAAADAERRLEIERAMERAKPFEDVGRCSEERARARAAALDARARRRS